MNRGNTTTRDGRVKYGNLDVFGAGALLSAAGRCFIASFLEGTGGRNTAWESPEAIRSLNGDLLVSYQQAPRKGPARDENNATEKTTVPPHLDSRRLGRNKQKEEEQPKLNPISEPEADYSSDSFIQSEDSSESESESQQTVAKVESDIVDAIEEWRTSAAGQATLNNRRPRSAVPSRRPMTALAARPIEGARMVYERPHTALARSPAFGRVDRESVAETVRGGVAEGLREPHLERIAEGNQEVAALPTGVSAQEEDVEQRSSQTTADAVDRGHVRTTASNQDQSESTFQETREASPRMNRAQPSSSSLVRYPMRPQSAKGRRGQGSTSARTVNPPSPPTASRLSRREERASSSLELLESESQQQRHAAGAKGAAEQKKRFTPAVRASTRRPTTSGVRINNAAAKGNQGGEVRERMRTYQPHSAHGPRSPKGATGPARKKRGPRQRAQSARPPESSAKKETLVASLRLRLMLAESSGACSVLRQAISMAEKVKELEVEVAAAKETLACWLKPSKEGSCPVNAQ